MLSIADFMLAILWGVGGVLWLIQGSVDFGRGGCFAVLLTTVVRDIYSRATKCGHIIIQYSLFIAIGLISPISTN